MVVQAYQGYFQEGGRFIPDEKMIKIPTNRRVIVNILNDAVSEVKTTPQRQGEALKKLLTTLSAISDEPLDEEFDEMLLQGFSFREVEL